MRNDKRDWTMDLAKVKLYHETKNDKSDKFAKMRKDKFAESAKFAES